MDHRILEQLTRIADALDEQNRLEREAFEFNKQLMEADIARQTAEQESMQSASTKDQETLLLCRGK